MEARATVNRPSVSKAFVAAILVLVVIGLGAMGGYLAKGIGVTSAGDSQATHPAPGTVLRQDNPSQSQPQDANTAPIRPVQRTRGDHGELP